MAVLMCTCGFSCDTRAALNEHWSKFPAGTHGPTKKTKEIIKLSEQFTSFDPSGDRRLGLSEMGALLRKGNPSISDVDVVGLFEAAKKDHENMVDFDEFLALLFSCQGVGTLGNQDEVNATTPGIRIHARGPAAEGMAENQTAPPTETKKELLARAKLMGISKNEIDRALEMEDSKAALAQAIREAEMKQAKAQVELVNLDKRQLKQQALSMNISALEVEAALEEDGAKEALIRLIMRNTVVAKHEEEERLKKAEEEAAALAAQKAEEERLAAEAQQRAKELNDARKAVAAEGAKKAAETAAALPAHKAEEVCLAAEVTAEEKEHLFQKLQAFAAKIGDVEVVKNCVMMGLSESAVKKLLAKEDCYLTAEESLDCIISCIRVGTKMTSSARGENVIYVIGNTGAGKSTTINYLFGCDMEEADGPIELLAGKIIVVKKGSQEAEVAKIGHTSVSMTFIPEIPTKKLPIAKNETVLLCDTPGFGDNRGPEINIANAVNTMETFTKSKTARLLVILNYHSLKADRGAGMRFLFDVLEKMFGGPDAIKQKAVSLIVAITRAPRDVSLDRIKAFMGTVCKDLKSVIDNVIVIDPVEKHPDCLQRPALLQTLWSLLPIQDTSSIFKTALIPSDTDALDQFVTPLQTKIDNLLESQAYDMVIPLIDTLQKLKCLKHGKVDQILQDATHRIDLRLKEMKESIQTNISAYERSQTESRNEDWKSRRGRLRNALRQDFADFNNAAVLDYLFDTRKFWSTHQMHVANVKQMEEQYVETLCKEKALALENSLNGVKDTLTDQDEEMHAQMLELDGQNEAAGRAADERAEHLADWTVHRKELNTLEEDIDDIEDNLEYRCTEALSKILTDYKTEKPNSVLREAIKIAVLKDDESKFDEELKQISADMKSAIEKKIGDLYRKILKIPGDADPKTKAEQLEEIYAETGSVSRSCFLSSNLNAELKKESAAEGAKKGEGLQERKAKVAGEVQTLMEILTAEARTAEQAAGGGFAERIIEILAEAEKVFSHTETFISRIKELRETLQQLAQIDPGKCRKKIKECEKRLAELIPIKNEDNANVQDEIKKMFASESYHKLAQFALVVKGVAAQSTCITIDKETLSVLDVDLEFIKTTFKEIIEPMRQKADKELTEDTSQGVANDACIHLVTYSTMLIDLESIPEFLPEQEAKSEQIGIGSKIRSRLGDFFRELSTHFKAGNRNVDAGQNFLIFSSVIFNTWRNGTYKDAFTKEAKAGLAKLKPDDLIVLAAVLEATKRKFDRATGLSVKYISASLNDMIGEYECFNSLGVKLLNEKLRGKTVAELLRGLSQLDKDGHDNQRPDHTILANCTTQVMDTWRLLLSGHFGSEQKRPTVQVTKANVKSKVGEIRKKLATTMKTSQGICVNGSEDMLCEMLGHIFAMWTLVSSHKDVERGDVHSCYQPLEAQVLAILVLLGVGTKTAMQNHVAEIGTGEGKSISLGMLAAVLCMIGCEVHVICYSPVLSERDYDLFRGVFRELQVYPKYETISAMAGGIMDTVYNCAYLAEQVVSGKKCEPQKRHDDNSILIIDEVDVFFGSDFYGQTRGLIKVFEDDCCAKLVEYVFNSKPKSLDEAMGSSEAKAVLNTYTHFGEDLLRLEVQRMLDDLKDLPAHEQLAVVNVDETAIGYEDKAAGGATSWNAYDGYKTMFQALKKLDHNKRDQWKTSIGIRLALGNIPYAVTPNHFALKLGLSGTLSHMSKHETDILIKEFAIKRFTKFPSVFNKKECVQKDTVVCQGERTGHYYDAIYHVMKTERERTGAALVVLKDQDACADFRKWLIENKDTRGGNWGVDITPHTLRDERGKFLTSIVMAGTAGSWTLMSRDFGRGTDFKCGDNECRETGGGMHVILTFPCELYSEQIQIRGRTCRQDDPGKFSKIYLEKDLEFLNAHWGDDKTVEQALALTNRRTGPGDFGKLLDSNFDNTIEVALARSIKDTLPKNELNPKEFVKMQEFVDLARNNDRRAIQCLQDLNQAE